MKQLWGAPQHRPYSSLFWLAVHLLCCLVSLVLGFRFSRVAFFLLLSPTSSPSPFLTPLIHPDLNQTSRVVVGRHGIRIRPWPHPDPTEVMTAHAIIDRVQREQRLQYGVRNPNQVVVVTPTYVRTFQKLHLIGVMHSLMLVPYDLVWVVVEAGGVSNETEMILQMSKIRVVHVPFDERMPTEWSDRHRMEARMRVKALRVIAERRLDGIVVFCDDSNMHSMEMFDEIQKVNWFGALSVGILAHSASANLLQGVKEDGKDSSLVPVQGPACNSSGKLVGWHTFNTMPYAASSAEFVGDDAIVLPTKMEWAGFALNARLLWKDTKDKPEWVKDVDSLMENEEGFLSPLDLLKDVSYAEPLGNCGRKVMLWWLRVEARADSKFPPGWVIDPPLEVIVPAKHTSWPGVPPGLPRKSRIMQPNSEKHTKPRTARSRHSSRKRKHELDLEAQSAGAFQRHGQGK